MTTLILAEHDHAILNGATARAVAAAREIGGPIHVVVAGSDVGAIAEAARTLEGVEKVLVADHPGLAHLLAGPVAELLVSLSGAYSHMGAPATSLGKDVLPRVAALLGVMQVSEVIAVHSPTRFSRPVYAGAAIQTVEATGDKVVLTIRAAAFEAVAQSGNAVIETIDFVPTDDKVGFVSYEPAGGTGPELASARVVISGGRSLGSSEQFSTLLEPLAQKLGGALGATRAAVDAGYAPNDWQVGQTGKIVQPDLYIAVGISGAVQHLAGMKNSKVIVAIDKDAEAPIFQIADYGLVGDLFEIVPELTKAL